MQVVVVVLNKPEYLEDVLSAFVENGISGATVLDSQGLVKAMMQGKLKEVPIYGSLKSFLEDAYTFNKTIFTVIESEEKTEEIITAIRELMEKHNYASGGVLFSVPVTKLFKF